MDKEYQEIKANLETLGIKLKEISAAPDMQDEKMKSLHDYLDNMHRSFSTYVDYLHQRINDNDKKHTDKMDNHLKNHLPAVSNAAEMEKHLKNIGASDNFDVIRPKINMAKANNRFILEAEYIKNKI